MLLVCLSAYQVTVCAVVSQAQQLLDRTCTTVRMLNTLGGSVAQFCMCTLCRHSVCVVCRPEQLCEF